jgi:hypothetical protein
LVGGGAELVDPWPHHNSSSMIYTYHTVEPLLKRCCSNTPPLKQVCGKFIPAGSILHLSTLLGQVPTPSSHHTTNPNQPLLNHCWCPLPPPFQHTHNVRPPVLLLTVDCLALSGCTTRVHTHPKTGVWQVHPRRLHPAPVLAFTLLTPLTTAQPST